MYRPLHALLPAVLLVCACGQQPDEQKGVEPTTPYGTVAQVEAYFGQIGPHVMQISQLQMQYETALSSAREGSQDRHGTIDNLAAKAKEVHPKLLALLAAFDKIEPPALLAPFHRDTRKLISLRLDAYSETIEGSRVEQSSTPNDDAYRQIEAALAEANRMIESLNRQQTQIDAAVKALATAPSS